MISDRWHEIKDFPTKKNQIPESCFHWFSEQMFFLKFFFGFALIFRTNNYFEIWNFKILFCSENQYKYKVFLKIFLFVIFCLNLYWFSEQNNILKFKISTIIVCSENQYKSEEKFQKKHLLGKSMKTRFWDLVFFKDKMLDFISLVADHRELLCVVLNPGCGYLTTGS